MKVSSDPQFLVSGDVLYAKKQFFRVMSAHTQVCIRCCLRHKNCTDYIGDFCPTSHYYEPAQVTPEIERALGIALLQGKVFAEEPHGADQG